MNIKTKKYICSVLAALALIGAASAGASAAVKNGIQSNAAAENGENAGYILRELDGHIAVYYAGFDMAPALVTEIEVDHLPEADRQALTLGLNVGTREELLQLLEDLGS